MLLPQRRIENPASGPDTLSAGSALPSSGIVRAAGRVVESEVRMTTQAKRLTETQIRIIANRVLCERKRCAGLTGACQHEAMEFARQIEHAVLQVNGLKAVRP